jgi:NrdJ_Z: ribonucleoside-diphosphate reductase, adenosylcobalamin-dependent
LSLISYQLILIRSKPLYKGGLLWFRLIQKACGIGPAHYGWHHWLGIGKNRENHS